MKTNVLMTLCVALLLGLTACGRRGPMEPPPDTPQGQAYAKQRASQNAKRGLPSPVATPATQPPNGKAQQDDAAAKEAEQDRADAQKQLELRDEDAKSERDKAAQDSTPPGAFPATAAISNPGAKEAGSNGPAAGKGRKPPKIERPKGSFILDPLLD